MNGGRCADTCSGATRMPPHTAQLRTIAGSEAVTGRRARRSGRRFLVVRPFRTHGEPNGHSDTGFATKTLHPCAWAEGRPPAAPAHPVRLFSTGRTRLGRGSPRSRHMDVISPPRFFPRLFSSRGPGCPRRAGGCSRQRRAPRRRQVDLDDSRLPVVMLCRPGRRKQDRRASVPRAEGQRSPWLTRETSLIAPTSIPGWNEMIACEQLASFVRLFPVD